MPDRTCERPNCTNTWHHTGRGRPRLYCTTECQTADQDRARPRTTPKGASRRRCADCGTRRPISKHSCPEGEYRCRTCRRAARSERDRNTPRSPKRQPKVRPCSHCGTPFTHKERVHCEPCTTAQVWKANRQTQPKARRRAFLVRQPQPRIGSASNARPWVSGQCKVCGQWYIGRDVRHTGCSAACTAEHRRRTAERWNKIRGRDHLKRARHYGVEYELVNRLRVFARDGWRCGICRRKVDRRLKAPHPMSASLDHIIPMSRGGGHTYVNTQCAHLTCNVHKGCGGMGEQLALVG